MSWESEALLIVSLRVSLSLIGLVFQMAYTCIFDNRIQHLCEVALQAI
jgi:hypothetical protein